jgi:hypothetical protein
MFGIINELDNSFQSSSLLFSVQSFSPILTSTSC